MRQRLGSIPAPPPFTYFEDALGVIYYSHGIVIAGDNPEIRASAVYLPGTMPDEDEHISWVTGRSYFKFINAGLEEERSALSVLPTDFHHNALSSRLRYDPETNEHYLAVPMSEVQVFFSAFDAPKAFDQGGSAAGAPHKVRKSVYLAIGELVRAGVARRAIGLYGGLQCGIGMADGTVHDVDLLVRGHGCYPKIVDHCLGKATRWVPDDRVARSSLLYGYERRRVRISQSHTLLDDEELLIDIRTTPLVGEHAGASCAANRKGTLTSTRVTATVLDAEASLSLPACFIVQPVRQATKLHVVSMHHHLMGCAAQGDLVEITGLLGDGPTIHVVDERTHGINVLCEEPKRLNHRCASR